MHLETVKMALVGATTQAGMESCWWVQGLKHSNKTDQVSHSSVVMSQDWKPPSPLLSTAQRGGSSIAAEYTVKDSRKETGINKP